MCESNLQVGIYSAEGFFNFKREETGLFSMDALNFLNVPF